MADRIPPPNPLPPDEQFTPGRDPGPDAHPPEDDFAYNVIYEDNAYKLEHYRAAAQALANELDCAVLLHFYALPHYQQTNGTLMAAFIPGEPQEAEAPPAGAPAKAAAPPPPPKPRPPVESWTRSSGSTK